jgi:hypothetical protein
MKQPLTFGYRIMKQPVTSGRTHLGCPRADGAGYRPTSTNHHHTS